MHRLAYQTLEKLFLHRPVDRLAYFVECCRGLRVLDVGSYDETACHLKKGSDQWLFARIERVASFLQGIDLALPEETIRFGSAEISRNDAFELKRYSDRNFDVITAGELIEHIQAHQDFLGILKDCFPGKLLILSMPNGSSVANFLMALISREAQHKDHVHVFTYKILNTIMERAGFSEWEIVPCYFSACEIKMQTKSVIFRLFIELIEKVIHLFDWLFPLTACNYIVKARI